VIAIAQAWSWRAATFSAGLVGLAALSFLVLNRHVIADTSAGVDRLRRGGGSFSFLRVGAVWLCFGFFLVAVMAFGGLQNFAAPVFERAYGVSLAVAASGLTAYLLGSAAGTGTGGFFTRGERQERLVAIALGSAALCSIALATAALPAWTIVGLMGLMGFGVGFSGPSRDILVRRAATSSFGAAAYGRIYGFVYSGIDTGLAFAPIVFGALMDRGRYTGVLWGVATLQTLAIFMALGVGWRARRRA